MEDLIIIDNDSFVVKAIDDIDTGNASKYVKIGESDIGYKVSSLTQFIPEFVDAGILSKSYSVTLPNGVGGILTEARNGSGLIPILRNIDTGEFTGQARLHELSTVAVVSGLMSGLSIVTSQYYLKQINQKLSDIQTKLDRVLDFLYTDKICELYAEAKLIFGIYRNYSSIINNDQHRIASLSTVQRAKAISEKNIQFYYRDMSKIASSEAKSQSKQERIAKDINDDLNAYNQAVTLFGLCCILEIVLSQNFDKNYLEYISRLIINLSMSHDIIIAKIQGKLDMVAEGAVGLINKKASPELINLVNDLESIIGDGSPIKEFQDLLSNIIDDATNKSEFFITEDGSVYKKK